MTDTIRIKRRVGGAAGAPASLANAELAYNEQDHTLYYGEGTGGGGGSATVVRPIGGAGLLASPVLTGTPTAPTPSTADNSTAIATTAYVQAQAYQTQAQVRATRLDQLAAPAAAVSMNSQTLTNVASPVAATDGANKSYVDASVQGLQVKPTAAAATTAALAANTYANGAAGIGATLTATGNGALAVDGYNVSVGDVILVKNEATASHNGLYVVTATGGAGAPYVLTRQADMQIASEFAGAFVPVGSAGAVNANSLWLANPSGAVTVGTTGIPFTQLNGATDLVAGSGIAISGNTISTTGLGTMAAQNANAVAITGGTIDGITIDGGTF